MVVWGTANSNRSRGVPLFQKVAWSHKLKGEHENSMVLRNHFTLPRFFMTQIAHLHK